jgi:hypothetical protein
VAWCGKLADFPTVGKPVASGAAQIRAAALCHYYHTQNISYGRKFRRQDAPLLTVTTISPFVQGIDKAKKI